MAPPWRSPRRSTATVASTDAAARAEERGEVAQPGRRLVPPRLVAVGGARHGAGSWCSSVEHVRVVGGAEVAQRLGGRAEEGGDAARGQEQHPVAQTEALDLDLYRDLRPVYRDTIHQVSETLKKIERHMTGWSSSLGGLLVMTPDEVQRRHEDIQAGLAEQSEPHSQSPGTPRARLTSRLREVTGRLRHRG